MKPVREMNEQEFKQFVGFTKEQACSMIIHSLFSPIPERAMLENAKMSSPEPAYYGAEADFLRKIGL